MRDRHDDQRKARAVYISPTLRSNRTVHLLVVEILALQRHVSLKICSHQHADQDASPLRNTNWTIARFYARPIRSDDAPTRTPRPLRLIQTFFLSPETM
jgi:hypothetical protein